MTTSICPQCGKSFLDLPCGPTHVVMGRRIGRDVAIHPLVLAPSRTATGGTRPLPFELTDEEAPPPRIGLAPACCCLVDRETGKTLEECTAHRRQRERH